MPEKTQDTNRTMLYLLGVVVVLLVVIVALVIVKAQGTNQQAVTPTTTTTDAGAASAQPTQAMPGVSPSGATFDAKTATKLASGVEPKDHVSAYYDAILAKKWEKAFKMQPAASQQGGTAADFEQTQTSYGMKSFKIASADVQGDTATVVATQDLGTNGTWTVTWTFVKSDGAWYVSKRQVAMGN